jgi:hypothetical protein
MFGQKPKQPLNKCSSVNHIALLNKDLLDTKEEENNQTFGSLK